MVEGDDALQHRDVAPRLDGVADMLGADPGRGNVVRPDIGSRHVGALVDEHDMDAALARLLEHGHERRGVGRGDRDAGHPLGDLVLDHRNLPGDVRLPARRSDGRDVDAELSALVQGALGDGGPERIGRTGVRHP